MTGASVREALDASVDALRAAGVEEPRLDAELLLGEAMGCERAALTADGGAEVPAPAARLFGEMVRRRLRREPVAYILGRKGFRHLDLMVDRRVLTPRPETELLVELALELQPERVLDVGTGSGAIALAVADELPECAVTATDTSRGALEVARANAERLGLADRIEFVEGTLPEAEFDLVLANLPYVAERDWPTLQPEVTQWEPREALLAGPNGLDAYWELFSNRGRAFRPIAAATSAAVTVAVEVGEGQAEAVVALMREAGFGAIETRRDLAGIDRVVLGRVGGAA
ncbi:MAG TPA: peptide chain release factor N(5)-glutamine methyltransferase [Solirubrobacterales bacterium]|nr:peptide chain release factor N(5)-glutamine methyltransferase [Solirubrobacterales bacterium]